MEPLNKINPIKIKRKDGTVFSLKSLENRTTNRPKHMIRWYNTPVLKDSIFSASTIFLRPCAPKAPKMMAIAKTKNNVDFLDMATKVG